MQSLVAETPADARILVRTSMRGGYRNPSLSVFHRAAGGAYRCHIGSREPAMMDVIVKSSEHTATHMDFSGLAAIVTGSTSGIGLGIARVFADLGMDVMLNGLGDPAAVEQARTTIEDDFGVKAVY